MNNKLIGRTGLDIDRKRAAEELGFQYFLCRGRFPNPRATVHEFHLKNCPEEWQRDAVRSDHPEQALEMLTPAAQEGDAEAALFLGNVYLYAHGIQPDYALARRWLEVAAREGRTDEQGIPEPALLSELLTEFHRELAPPR